MLYKQPHDSLKIKVENNNLIIAVGNIEFVGSIEFLIREGEIGLSNEFLEDLSTQLDTNLDVIRCIAHMCLKDILQDGIVYHNSFDFLLAVSDAIKSTISDSIKRKAESI